MRECECARARNVSSPPQWSARGPTPLVRRDASHVHPKGEGEPGGGRSEKTFVRKAGRRASRGDGDEDYDDDFDDDFNDDGLMMMTLTTATTPGRRFDQYEGQTFEDLGVTAWAREKYGRRTFAPESGVVKSTEGF